MLVSLYILEPPWFLTGDSDSSYISLTVPRLHQWSSLLLLPGLGLGQPTEQRRRIFLNQQPAKEQIAVPHLVLGSGISSTSLPGLLLLCIHHLLLLLYPSSSLLFPFPCLSLSFSLRHSLTQSFFCLLSPFSVPFLFAVLPSPQSFSDFSLVPSGSFPAFAAFLFPFPPCLANTFISLCL